MKNVQPSVLSIPIHECQMRRRLKECQVTRNSKNLINFSPPTCQTQTVDDENSPKIEKKNLGGAKGGRKLSFSDPLTTSFIRYVSPQRSKLGPLSLGHIIENVDTHL